MFSEAETVYLTRAMWENKVVLLLGAGASYGSKTSRGDEIPLGKNLEVFLRGLIGSTDEDLRLDQIGKDARGILGDEGLKSKLEDVFMETRPSPNLVELFSYKWNRCYTLNYDDTIEGIPRHLKKQRHRYYVGTDKFEEPSDLDDLQVIHLNGSILKFEKGIVLTDKEFRAATRKHTPWYEKCSADYASKTFIFIGTSLDEPIFKAYVESIEGVSSFAKSFLISPSTFSARDVKEFSELNITVKSNTLADFTVWLKKVSDIRPKDQTNISDLVVEIGSPAWISKYIDKSALRTTLLRRNFYAGLYPTWQCVASKWPANLSTMAKISDGVLSYVSDHESGICLIVGQSGSGKTTCLMNSLYTLSDVENCRTFEFKGDNADKLDQAVVSVKLHSSKDFKCIIWVPDFQIYADDIEKISRLAKLNNVTILAELRSSDWSGRFFGKHKEAGKVLNIPKLVEADYELLAEAIMDYATAPEFRRLTKVEQVRQLKKSKNQLLILMLEATKQRPFEEIIEDEYLSIKDNEAQAFLCIVALITLTRSRLSISDYSTIVSLFGLRSPLSVCLASLEGIVELTSDGMLVGRHESYVSHILSKAASMDTIFDACLAIFRSFTIFEVPFVINAGKIKGNILKFMMRGSFLLQIFRGDRGLVERVYEELEFDFQNDGHFWLQRGKFFRSLNTEAYQKIALKHFERSVEAYDSSYARHSLALQKLIYCAQFRVSTPHLDALLNEAVTELRKQVVIRQDAEDEYPLVALATFHPKVLIAWGRTSDAKTVCRDYHTQLSMLHKQMSYPDQEVLEAIRYCLQVTVS